ncbi:MAG: hypothetical protein JST20_02110 [Bacteroidetes bacterium]|nr:hypothetical protein [Bacteroidota bacterium]
MNNSSLLREIVVIIIISVCLGIGYNQCASPKKIPLLREEQVLVQADDSQLFAPSASSSTQQPTIETSKPLEQTPQPSVKTPMTKDTTSKVKTNAPPIAKVESPSVKETPNSSSEKPKPASVTYSQVLRLLEDKDVLFIDARNDDEWNAGHIPGAIHIFPEDFQKHIPEIIGLPRDKRIVAYCSGGPECPLSHEICEQLANFGFKRLFIYFGGWTEWKKMKAEGK